MAAYYGGRLRQKGNPMIMLLALPVIAAVALAHRSLLLYAPANVLIRRVRASTPALSTAAAMLAVALGLIVALKVVSDALAAGAPGWLNLVVLVLAWAAIKLGWLALAVLCRWFRAAARRRVGHRSGRVHVPSYS